MFILVLNGLVANTNIATVPRPADMSTSNVLTSRKSRCTAGRPFLTVRQTEFPVNTDHLVVAIAMVDIVPMSMVHMKDNARCEGMEMATTRVRIQHIHIICVRSGVPEPCQNQARLRHWLYFDRRRQRLARGRPM